MSPDTSLPQTPQDAQAEYKRLAEEIRAHDRRYYENDAPSVSDAEYDALRKRLIAIEAEHPELITPDSPTQKVSGAPSEKFAKAKHGVPMLSLDNAFDAQDVDDFVGRVRRFLNLKADDPVAFTAEPKIDGLSANLRYEKGRFVLGLTRGDGEIGENVTANLKTIADIPHALKGDGIPDLIEIRGEVYMGHEEFRAFNARQEAAGKPIAPNPRNLAGGSLRQLDAGITCSRHLHFFAYAWGENTSLPADTQMGMVEAMKAWGFVTNPRMSE